MNHLQMLAVLGVLVVSFGAGCKDKKKKKDTTAAVGKKVPVEAVLAVRQPIRDTLIATSTVESRNSVDIVAEIPGVIVALEVEQGDVVKKKQRLARLKREELNLGLDIAASSVGRLKSEVERLRPLRVKGVISQQMFDDARYRLEQAQGEQRRAKTAASDMRVTSPIDGVIAMRSVNLGQQVAIGTPLFRVVDPAELIVGVNFPENALGKVYQGQDAYIESQALGALRFAAKVERISPVVDPRTGTIRVVLSIVSDHPIGTPELGASDSEQSPIGPKTTEISPAKLDHEQPVGRPQLSLRPGMFVKAFVVIAERQSALVIPRRAVIYVDENATVFVVKDGQAKRVNVVLGVAERAFVEVVEGLDDGAAVIVLGQDGLKDATPVDVELRKGEGA